MSYMITAKQKVDKGPIASAFKNENGAIDLSSIMVGIIVIGLIGGVIAATVFSVIPWSQDNAAKQQLDSVAAAQSAYIGLSYNGTTATYGGAIIDQYTSGSTSRTTYTADIDTNNRTSVGGASPVAQVLFSAPAESKIIIGKYGVTPDAHYVAAIKSASGTRFYITDTNTRATSAGTSGNLGTQFTVSGATPAQVNTAKTNAVINAALDALPS